MCVFPYHWPQVRPFFSLCFILFLKKKDGHGRFNLSVCCAHKGKTSTEY